MFPATNNSLCLMLQGNGESNRIGRKCVVQQVMIRGRFNLLASGTVENGIDSVRLMVIQDRQAQVGNPTVAGVLAGTDIDAFRNLQQTSRFLTLFDETYDIVSQGAMGNGTTNDIGPAIKSVDVYKRCNVPLEYSASTGAIADLESNSVFVMCISQRGLAKFEGNARVRFIG